MVKYFRFASVKIEEKCIMVGVTIVLSLIKDSLGKSVGVSGSG